MADLNDIEPEWRTLIIFFVAGYGIGMRSSLFLTCRELQVSGTELPDYCVPDAGAANAQNAGGRSK